MKVIIVDDERLARKELRTMLSGFSEVEILAECENAQSAIEEIEKQKPDLVFLDINMPGKDGFSLLEELDDVPEIIFVTAYDEYALKAFEVNALDYLLKPVQVERLQEALNKFNSTVSIKNNSQKLDASSQIFVKNGERCWFVKLADVPLFESEGNYVRIYFETNKPLILKSLNNLENRLDENVFFRANRKHIINLLWIESVENWFNGGLMVKLKTGMKIEVSRRQASKLKDMKSL
ncbi:MAG: response regulator transcription factor [Flavobacteriales bacterium]|nr:response regulator transcription factor [Flavobacteriales bacterium]